MSSSSRRRPERRRLLAALLVGLVAGAGLWAGTAGAAARLDIAAVVPVSSARSVSLVAGVRPAPASLKSDAFSVTARGTRLPVTAVPVMSEELTTGLVLDTSAAGAAALQGGLNGAADYLLALPTGARTIVVTDGGPPALLVPLGWQTLDAVAAVTSVRAGGRRDTGAALELALARLPVIPGRPRVLLLHTGAADAGGESAAALGARLRDAGVLLAVVATGDDQRFWSRVAGDTGGILVTARGSAALGAFQEVAAVLRGRYVLTFPLPPSAPGSVEVRVDTPDGPATATVTVPGTGSPAADVSAGGGLPWTVLVLVLLALAAAVAVTLLRRARRTPPPRSVAPPQVTPPSDGPPSDGPPSVGPRSAGPPSAGRRSAGPPSVLPRSVLPRSVLPPAVTPAPVAPAVTPAPVAPAVVAGPLPRRRATQEIESAVGAGSSRRQVGEPRPTGTAVDADEMAYERLDAAVGRVAADVAAGRLEFRRGVARIAMSAPGRIDLLDRVIGTERRLRGARLGASPPASATLELLFAARRVVLGEVALVGPSGVRVEQAPADPNPVLRLRSRNGPVRLCRSLDELARHVDLSALTADPR